jgi:hypothetical protein
VENAEEVLKLSSDSGSADAQTSDVNRHLLLTILGELQCLRKEVSTLYVVFALVPLVVTRSCSFDPPLRSLSAHLSLFHSSCGIDLLLLVLHTQYHKHMCAYLHTQQEEPQDNFAHTYQRVSGCEFFFVRFVGIVHTHR